MASEEEDHTALKSRKARHKISRYFKNCPSYEEESTRRLEILKVLVLFSHAIKIHDDTFTITIRWVFTFQSWMAFTSWTRLKRCLLQVMVLMPDTNCVTQDLWRNYLRPFRDDVAFWLVDNKDTFLQPQISFEVFLCTKALRPNFSLIGINVVYPMIYLYWFDSDEMLSRGYDLLRERSSWLIIILKIRASTNDPLAFP